jgi:tRNA threonylcarbamoyladenosine biosynthesis protein TsaE
MEMQILIIDLDKFAVKFWKYVKTAKVFAFHGEMGSGKTTIIKALCKYKGVLGNMSSPSFSIINEYDYDDEEGLKKIFHIDLYRLKDAEEVMQAGVEECLHSGSLCFVEWPEKAPELFVEKAWHIIIEPVNKNSRRIKINPGLQSSSHVV